MGYRSRKERRREETATDGLVADMVRQFADRYAFVRELIQNGIDAGATELEVRARHFGGEGVLSVRDDGEGMTREIVEGPLLTLFNSAKDEDDSKIGKYGVGFVSVFAIDPDEVLVETWRVGESWLLSLQPDHSYELATSEPSPFGESGTIVSLKKRMGRDTFREHVEAMSRALLRWCRHARLPIHFRVDEEGAAPFQQRIDTPLSVKSAVSITAELDGMHIAVGAGASVEPGFSGDTFGGFYNRGLTLFETSEPLSRALTGLAFKVDAPRLSHTLSRDNVRHDEAYKLAVRRVEELAKGALVREVESRLSEAAEAAAADEAAGAAFAGVLFAACTSCLRLGAAEITVPLCEPTSDGSLTAPAAELEADGIVLYEAAPNAITRRLREQGRKVLRAAWPTPVLEALASKLGRAIHPAHAAVTLLTPLAGGALEPGDAALAEAVAALLGAAREAVSGLALAESAGAEPRSAAVRVATASEPQLVTADDRVRRFRWQAHDAWLLPVSHEAVVSARALARHDVRTAAHLLTRYILLEGRGELDKRASDALLGAYAERP